MCDSFAIAVHRACDQESAQALGSHGDTGRNTITC